MKRSKAQITGLAMFVSMVVMMSLVLIFLLIINVQDKARENEIKERKDSLDKDLLLLGLLQTRIDEYNTFADIINLYIETKDANYKSTLEGVSKEVLNPFYKGNIFWRLEVNGEKLFKQNDNCDEDLISTKQEIISFNGKNIVRLYDCDEGFFG